MHTPEHEEKVEIEFKFIPKLPENAVVNEMTSLFGGNFGFVKWPPMVNLDIYLDTAKFDLHRMNSPLRLRRWASPFKQRGINCNFKYPPIFYQGLRRRELKTVLTDKQATAVCGGAIIGESARHAADFASRSGVEPEFAPQIVIYAHSSYYALRQCDDLHACGAGLMSSRRTPLRGKSNNLLLLCFEYCTAQRAPEFEFNRLIRNGLVDCAVDSVVVSFSEAELEVYTSPENASLAEELYGRAFSALRDKNVEMPETSKYSRVVQEMGLT